MTSTTSIAPEPAPARFSLNRDLSARLSASIATGCFLSAAAACGSTIMAAAYPKLAMQTNSRCPIYVREEVAAAAFVNAAVLFLPALYWIWSRHWVRIRPLTRPNFLRGAVVSIAVLILLPVVSRPIIRNSWQVFDGEMLMVGLLCLVVALPFGLWTRQWRRGGVALIDAEGLFTLRCPECNYNMNGLREARCPECGRAYTLDEFLQKQRVDYLRVI